MAEVESKQGKAPRREEELVEAALAAAAAALLVSGVKKLAPAVLVPRWSWLWWPLPAALPSPVLFLLLNVVIASIVVASVRPVTVRPAAAAGDDQGARKLRKKRSKRRDVERAAATADVGCCMAIVVKKDDTAKVVDAQDATAGGDAGAEEEVDRRAEEFISAFRHRLRVDSFSSRRRDPQAGGEAAAALATVAPCC